MPPPAMPPTLHNVDDVGKYHRAPARGMLWLEIRLLSAGCRFEFTQPLSASSTEANIFGDFSINKVTHID
jgi:hypothetical protein